MYALCDGAARSHHLRVDQRFPCNIWLFRGILNVAVSLRSIRLPTHPNASGLGSSGLCCLSALAFFVVLDLSLRPGPIVHKNGGGISEDQWRRAVALHHQINLVMKTESEYRQDAVLELYTQHTYTFWNHTDKHTI